MRALRRIRHHSHAPATPDTSWKRDVRLLATSRGISMGGAEAGHIALLALAWHLTGSASHASLVLLASVLARTLGAPLAGWIGDTIDRRRVIITGEIAVAALMFAMAFATQMWHLLVLSALVSFAATMIGAALDAALPNLAPRAHLGTANAMLGMARTAGHMLGPVAGGLLVAAFGARTAFVLDGASSLVAAAVMLGVRGATSGGGSDAANLTRTDEDRGALVGLRVLAAEPVLRMLIYGWVGMCVCFAFITAAELPLAIEFGFDEAGLGAIVSCWCAGALLGSWMARLIDVERRGVPVLAINAGLCAFVFAGAGLAPSFIVVLALMAIGGCSMALAEVVEMTIIQQRIEDAVRARALAAYQGLLSALWGVTLAGGALLVDATSARTTYVIAGGFCVVGMVGFLVLMRAMRRMHDTALIVSLRGRHALEADLAEGA